MMNKWKKRVLCLALIICGLAVLASGTAAYFVSEETAHNVITTGILYMELMEETTGGQPWPEEGIKNVVPGMTVDKIVQVRNEGGVPFFARISMDQVVIPGPGVEAELSFEYISLDLNTEQWIEKDGYYYYYRILEPGEMTEPLFTKVSFAPQMTNDYQSCTVEIHVLAQAVQSANNGTDPLNALGWSEGMKTLILNTEEE